MIALWLLGCILGPRPDACTANTDCREAFGLGAVCGTEGYCEDAAPEPRCATAYPEDLFDKPENYADALVLGTIFNMPFDEKQRLSAELAVRNVREADRSSGAYGQSVVIIHCDNADNIDYDDLIPVDAAAKVARYLAEDLGVQAIIGPSTSDEAFAVFDAASPHGAITISPSATSPTLTDLGGYPTPEAPGLFWRSVPPDDLQAFAIGRDLIDRNVNSVYILYQESSYATALADAVESNFAGGGRTVTRRSYVDAQQLSQVADEPFLGEDDEVLFFSSESSEVVTFLDSASLEPASLGRPIFLADAAADNLIFTAGGGAVLFDQIRGSRPAVPKGNIFGDFVASYSDAYDDTPSDSVFTSYTFDAAWLALYGAAYKRGEMPVTGTTIGQGILNLGSGDTYNVGYNDIKPIQEALVAGTSVNLEGASGPLDFDAVTGEVSNAIEIWVIDTTREDFVPVKVCEPGGACNDVE